MGKYPEKYGIGKIKKIFSPINDAINRYHPLHTLEFDELNGKLWPEKYRQIIDSSNTVRDLITKYKLQEANQDRLHVLFALYDRYFYKDEIRSKYRRWMELF
jgi:hypothetical protein